MGFKPGAAGWNPLSYGGTPANNVCGLPSVVVVQLAEVRCSNPVIDKIVLLLKASQRIIIGAVVVAQLVERSLLIPEVRGSNPVIGKNLFI